MLKLFFRKPKPAAGNLPAGLSEGQVSDLRALAQQPGYKVYLSLLEEQAAREAGLLFSCTDANTAFGIANRVQVWQRCHALVENLSNAVEAIDAFRQQQRNGASKPANPAGRHLGSPNFWG